jgi:ATP-dependent Clp protease adapter protein ClpS
VKEQPLTHSSVKWTSSLTHQNVPCSHHDIAKTMAHLQLNNNHSLYLPVEYKITTLIDNTTPMKYKITTLIDKTTPVKYKITTLIDNTTPVKYEITTLIDNTTPVKYKITTLIDNKDVI